jgi:hypothetical protein
MLLTVQEAAREAKVSVKTIRRLCKSGRLKCENYGGPERADYRIAPASLVSVQAPVQPAPPPPVTPPPSRGRRQSASRPSQAFDPLAWAR